MAATLRDMLNLAQRARAFRQQRAHRGRWLRALSTLAALSCGSGATDAPGIARIELNPASLSLTIGEARSFSARVVDGQGNTVAGTLYWSSENAAVATVSDAGVVTAVGVGSTRIAASAGGKAAVATVNVSARPVSSVRVTPSSTRLEVGATVTLTASAFDAGGSPLPGLTPSWFTANPTIATITEGGLVTAVAPGVATVSATVGGASGTAVIHVDAIPVASVRITPGTGALLEGETLQLTAEALDAQGVPLDGRTIAWRSSTLAVASVSSDGLVVALTPGTATITATTEGKSSTAAITVSPVPVAAIEINPGSVVVSAGNSVQFTGFARDKSGNVLNRPLTWTSDQPAIATVSSTGLASALQQGSVRISASSGGKTGTATLTINPIPVASVSITPATVSLQTGDTASLGAVVRDASGNVLSGRQVSWLSGAPNVISVSNAGLVTAVGTGSAIIFATSEGVSGTSSITVSAPPAPVASIAVSPTVLTLQPGSTRQLAVVARDAAGNILTGRPIVWSSNTPNVATVSATGLVTALVDGTATITASNGSVSGSATASVVTPVSSITVAPSTANLLVGDTRQLSAVGRDAAGNVLPGRVYTWISSAPTIASVNNNGLVTAVGAGTATISAYTGGLSGSASVTVTVPTPVVASIDVTPSTSTLQPNATQALVAVAKDASGKVIPGQSFVWATSATAVATVSTTGTVTAVAAGTATITASSGGIDGTASVTVSAAPPTIASIAVTPATASLTTGGVQALTATASDAAGNVIGGVAFTWSSNATAVASVSGTGSVTAVGAGAATITATSAGVTGTAAIVVSAPAPTLASITVAPSTSNMVTGDVRPLTATARDNAGNIMSGVAITWSSNASNVATVSNTGSVTAVASGSATITASNGSINGTAAVVVTTPTPVVASIAVTPPTNNLLAGGTQQLVATAKDASGVVITGQTFTWSSSASQVATVSSGGLVTAVGAGNATITASSGTIDGTSAITVSVPAPTVASVDVTPTGIAIAEGQGQQLVATARDAQGNTIPGKTAAWSSSDASVATVSASGMLSGVQAGKVTVSAVIDGISGSAPYTVTLIPVQSVSLAPTSPTILTAQTVALTPTVTGPNGQPLSLSGRTVAWTTSSSAVATVSSSGVVSGVSAGSATISLTVDGKVGTSTVTVQVVQPSVPPIASVSWIPNTVTIQPGQDAIVMVVVRDVNGRAATNRTCTLTSPDPSRATVNPAQANTGQAGLFLATISGIRRVSNSSPVNVAASCGGVSDNIKVYVR